MHRNSAEKELSAANAEPHISEVSLEHREIPPAGRFGTSSYANRYARLGAAYHHQESPVVANGATGDPLNALLS